MHIAQSLHCNALTHVDVRVRVCVCVNIM